MPIKCQKADSFDLELLDKAVKKYHPTLLSAEVRIGMVMLWDEPRGDADPKPPIRVHGCPALARVRRLNVRDRLLTGKTITIEVDWREWPKMTVGEQMALLDHELTHVVLNEIREGVYAHHGDGHPEVKLRPDDYTINGFFEVARRHGRESAEVRSLERVLATTDDKGQLWLPFDAHVITAGGEVVRPNDRRAVTAVTISSGGKSVTLTGGSKQKAAAMAGG